MYEIQRSNYTPSANVPEIACKSLQTAHSKMHYTNALHLCIYTNNMICGYFLKISIDKISFIVYNKYRNKRKSRKAHKIKEVIIMTKQTYNLNQQKEIKIFATIKEARAEARKYGEEFEAVRALDLYTRRFLGYTVEHK